MLHGARQSHSVLLSYRLREGWELMTTTEGVLRELLAEAMGAMEQASGGASVCSFTKSGVPVPALKYAEGRWAALRELKSQGATEEASLALGAVCQERLAELQSRGAGSDWLAYTTGGVDALAEFRLRVSHDSGDDRP